MSREYNIRTVQRRDEWNGKFGMMVDFALSLEGVDGWVKLSQKLATPGPQAGDTIYGELTTGTYPKSGDSYKKLARKNPQYENQDKPSNQSDQANHKIDYIVQMLEEMTGRREAPDIKLGSEPKTEDPFPGL